MKNIFLSIFSLVVLAFCSYSQVTEPEKILRNPTNDTIDGWKKGVVIALTFSQTSLTNWAAGGQNSIALNGIASIFLNYKKKKSAWDNSLDIGYGLLKQGKNAPFWKTDDKIDFMSKYGKHAFNNWYYAALVNAKTQMTEGYNYPNDSVKISDRLAPCYIVGAVGFDNKPNKYLSMFVAPLTSKITIVNDQGLANAGAFGVEKAVFDEQGNIVTKGLNRRMEFGGYVRFIYTRNEFESEFLKNVSFSSKIDLFSNYLQNPKNIDINWETLITFKINKYITVNFNTHLIYDDDIMIAVDKNKDGTPESKGPRTQFKEIFGLGFTYKL